MRSSSDCKIAGVCGGIAEYLDVDSTAIRLIWALAFVFTALVPATVAYVIIWLIVPQAPPLAVRAPEAGNAAPHTGSAPAI